MKIYMPAWIPNGDGVTYLLDGSPNELFIGTQDNTTGDWRCGFQTIKPEQLDVFFTDAQARAAFCAPSSGRYVVLQIDLETGECS